MKRRAFLLAMMLCLIPIALIMMITLSGQLMQESGMTIMAQRRAKAFYLAQAGLTAGFQLFSANNFQGRTFESDGVTATLTSSPDFLRLYGLTGLTYSGGWYTWKWNPGDPEMDSYTRSGAPETYRFKVYLPTGTSWKIEVEAVVDGQISRQEMGGSLESPYNYTVFDNGDCNDFTKAEDYAVQGSVYANGDLYLRPWATPGMSVGPFVIVKPTVGKLDFDVDSITAAGKILRSRDALGEADPGVGGDVTISSTANTLAPTLMEGKKQGFVGPGNAYDSENPNWRSTALSKYKNTVTDGELGAKKKALPGRGVFLPGGYLDGKADLHVDSSTSAAWCSDKTFYNQAENRSVTVKEIDVSQALGALPPGGGLIYSKVPVRLVNAAKVDKKFSLASCATVYTKGDFNKDFPDAAAFASGVKQSKPASIMTTDRVYALSDSFNDAASATYYDPANPANLLAPKYASDAPHYAGDPADRIELNAAIVDGRATRDTRVWVDSASDPTFPQTPNPFKVSTYFYFPTPSDNTGTRLVPDTQDSHPGLKIAYPNGDDYLENLQKIKFNYRGPHVHTRHAKMAKWDNSDSAADPTITPWIVKSSYIPADRRDYQADPNLALPGNAPPIPIWSCRKLLWKVLQ